MAKSSQLALCCGIKPKHFVMCHGGNCSPRSGVFVSAWTLVSQSKALLYAQSCARETNTWDLEFAFVHLCWIDAFSSSAKDMSVLCLYCWCMPQSQPYKVTSLFHFYWRDCFSPVLARYIWTSWTNGRLEDTPDFSRAAPFFLPNSFYPRRSGPCSS